jgi:hypothetical protein
VDSDAIFLFGIVATCWNCCAHLNRS